MSPEAPTTENAKPRESQVQPDNIPIELRRCAQWVCWRYVHRGEGKKPDKQPVNPRNLHNAGIHWPSTWSNFEHVYMTYLAYRRRGLCGVGFVLTEQDPFVAVDLDNCVDAGTITQEAQAVVEHLASYTEFSPSGHGLRIMLACPGFMDNRRHQKVEIYSHDRFVTITGNYRDETPGVVSATSAEAITVLLPQESKPRPHAEAPLAAQRGQALDGMALWEQIFAHDKFGAEHRRRFQGDTSLDGGDHSLTVIRLLNCLARWTNGDAAQMREMMVMSPLANDKWLSVHPENARLNRI